jgi:hypothetical protein
LYVIKGNTVCLLETRANQFNLHNNQTASEDKVVEGGMKKVIDAIVQLIIELKTLINSMSLPL